jgi:hypothetical protein
MIAKLTRAQLEALAYVGVLVLLSTMSTLFDVPAGVKSDLSFAASQPVATAAAATVQIK